MKHVLDLYGIVLSIGLIDFGQNDNRDTVTQALLKTATLNIQDNVDEMAFQSVLNDQHVCQSYSLFQKICGIVQEMIGFLSFWMSYIDLVSLLLDFIQTSRDACWTLHLLSVREMIPWCFIYNRSNYSRYLPWYYYEMACLPQTHPELHAYIENGGFSCQIGPVNTVGRIPSDQTIEETINKTIPKPQEERKDSVQEKIAVSKYYITADDRANYVRKLRAMIDTRNQEFWHPYLTKPRFSGRWKRCEVVIQHETWKNPIELSDKELFSISTGSVPSPIVINDVLCRAKRREGLPGLCKQKIMWRLIQYLFWYNSENEIRNVCKQNCQIKNIHRKRNRTKSWQKLILINDHCCQTRQLDVKKSFCHPLDPVPWALSTSSGSIQKN